MKHNVHVLCIYSNETDFKNTIVTIYDVCNLYKYLLICWNFVLYSAEPVMGQDRTE